MSDVARSSVVLIVEDEDSLREGMRRALTMAGLEAHAVADLASARTAVAKYDLDCILLDVRLPDGDGLTLLSELRERLAPDVPVIVATSFGDSARMIRAMSLGAHDYVTKPFDLPRLRATVQAAVRARALTRASVAEPRAVTDHEELIGHSTTMREVWKAVGRAASCDAPVLITGETGTGKELVARAIHRHSRRASGPFVAVNLAALPPSLIESELFGHERGAFTGADQARIGRIEAAAGGTLFLDEIGELAPELQPKLLRLLQERTFERVGSDTPRVADVRFVAATLEAVDPEATAPRLRADLYYRLAVLAIEVPPLRARREDIPLLVRFGVEQAGARGITAEALALLETRQWRGNVRELLHLVSRAALAASNLVIDTPHIMTSIAAPLSIEKAASDALGHLSLPEAIAVVERALVTAALARSSGNRSGAARLLGVGRQLLYAKLREHGLETAEEETQ